MSAPEVTRQEAARIAAEDAESDAALLARTVVALYDDVAWWQADSISEEQRHRRITLDWAELTSKQHAMILAMRECIDRLRDGWVPATGGVVYKDGTEPAWVRLVDGTVELWGMTPKQQAVMAR